MKTEWRSIPIRKSRQAGRKRTLGLTRLNGIGDDIVPLNQEEINFLERFGGENQVVEMSVGVIGNSKIIVSSGSLRGWQVLSKGLTSIRGKWGLRFRFSGERRMCRSL